MTATPRVYSYLRFSDSRQAAGSSADRQAEYARRWAAEHGIVLDEALSMRDEGLSAYHQRHVARGALGAFLVAIDAGRIAPGSVLIVEGLDRLSRAEPIQAQAQLAQIITAGISVVTASDGKVYDRERLRQQPMDLVYSLLVMIRAHEESDTKSKRVRAAIRGKCEAWRAGTWRGRIRLGSDPAWLRWTGDAWEVIPERAEAVRAAVAMFLRGEGSVRIRRRLDALGLRLTERQTSATNLYKVFRLRALVGERSFDVGGEAFTLAGYYPALMSEAAFDELQRALGQRELRIGRSAIAGIVTGLDVLKCGYCGTAVGSQNLVGRAKADGALADSYRRLVCAAHRYGERCPVGGSCSVVPVERALLTYCSDQINLTALLTGDTRAETLRAELAGVRGEQANVAAQLERITTALTADDGPAPQAFLRKARELEAQAGTLADEAGRIERDLAALSQTSAPALAEQWGALVERAMALDEDARLQVRQLVADTFERLVIYVRGVEPSDQDEAPIDLLLVSRAGQMRMLTFDRRTGALRVGVDVGALPA